MIIKVCGMRDADNIRAVADLGVDLIGFVFCPQSLRFVKMIPSRAGIIPDYSEQRLKEVAVRGSVGNNAEAGGYGAGLLGRPKRVGVFVNDMPQNIVTRVYNYKLDYIQLHGNEPRETCENLRKTLEPDIKPDIKIIKTISVAEEADIFQYRQYAEVVDLLLFDTKSKTAGGSGKHFDWSVLETYDGELPFILSGGIGPDDVERVKCFAHPKCVGIDLNSRFETEPGMKDVEKLAVFLKALGR